MAVVTVSRLYGAGGVRVADALAEAFGFQRADREVVEEAARRAGMDPEVAEHLDERAPGLLEEAGLALAAASFAPPPVDDRVLAEGVRRVIEGLAAAGGYVILGRGGQVVLRDRADACHLQLVASLDERARRVAGWQGVSVDEARERCRRADADRAAYVRRFEDVDIADPSLYDAVINSERLGIEGASAAAIAVARTRLGPD